MAALIPLILTLDEINTLTAAEMDLFQMGLMDIDQGEVKVET